MKLLPLCAALAAGEALSLGLCLSSATWPFFAIVAATTASIGFAYQWRFWPVCSIFFFGFAIALFSSCEIENTLRTNPWMRERQHFKAHEEEIIVVKRIKCDLSKRIGIGLENRPQAAALNKAILLGEKEKLPKKTKQAFIESGTMHLFAVSGFHVMIIAQTILILFLLLLCPYNIAPVFAIPVLWLYVFVIGCPPSAVRASTMATFYLAATVFYRKCDSLRAWCQTFLLIHIFSPRMIINIGSLLSFTVMLSILLCLRVAPKKFTSVYVTFAAWAAGVPIAARVFERITPGGLIANLITMPLAGISITGGTLGALSSYVSKTIASHLNNLSALACENMTLISEAVSRLPFSDYEIPKWSFTECALWYSAMILSYVLVCKIKQRRRLI
jgi:ComEC/Rec2-related protein